MALRGQMALGNGIMNQDFEFLWEPQNSIWFLEFSHIELPLDSLLVGVMKP